MTKVAFFVAGAVSGQGSKRPVTRGGRTVLLDMNAQLKPWRESIAYAARQSAQETLNWRDHHGPAFTGPVSVTLDAGYARPKSHYGTGRNSQTLKADAPQWKTSPVDVDKVARAALDALTTSGIWRDDAQVSLLTVGKGYVDNGEQPGLHVEVEALT